MSRLEDMDDPVAGTGFEAQQSLIPRPRHRYFQSLSAERDEDKEGAAQGNEGEEGKSRRDEQGDEGKEGKGKRGDAHGDEGGGGEAGGKARDWKSFCTDERFQVAMSWVLLLVFAIALLAAAVHINKGIWTTMPWPLGLATFAMGFRKVWPEKEYVFVITMMVIAFMLVSIGSLVYQFAF